MPTTGSFEITTNPPGTRDTSPPEKPVRPRVPRRRRWPLLSAAAALVAVSVLGNIAVVSALREREPMLLLARDVAWGQRLSALDVTTVDLPQSARRFAVPDAQRSQILGRVATGSLRAGTLLALTDVTTHTIPAAGQTVVGIRLEPGRFPARGLSPNDAVHVVALARQSGAAGSDAAPDGAGFAARVVQVSAPDAEGAITADVLVPATSAEQAARAAAGGALVLLLGPPH